MALAIIVLGASGDLATRKIFPAIFALHARGHLPPDTWVFGFARSELTDEEFRQRMAPNLRCEELPGEVCDLRRGGFILRCRYVRGAYDQPAAFTSLRRTVEETCGPGVDQLVYLAIPPHLFGDVACAMRQAGVPPEDDTASGQPWWRVVIEKPFGHDRQSSDELTRVLQQCIREHQTYRIDHYLGKEVIQNLMVLRFANAIFEPVWNRQHIRHVHISWAEDIPLSGRAGYFDNTGIIRDVMQNHLTQILALIAMECPRELGSHCVRDEKVRLLRQVLPLTRDRCILGQYTAGTAHGLPVPGYLEESGVPAGSRTATYAAAVFDVHSPRWRGVPFLISAAKGVAARRTEIRVRFKAPDNDLFGAMLTRSGAAGEGGPLPRGNELVIRVQPDETIMLRIISKVPGPGYRLDAPNLDLSYREAYAGQRIGDAYETLLLDVIRGDRSLFIRDDELAASWDIYTPLLHELDAEKESPLPYPFGSDGPAAINDLAARFGIEA